MTDFSLRIVHPEHDSGFAGTAPIQLAGTIVGSPKGLFFKWFSSLNAAVSAGQPELNGAEHSIAALTFNAPLPEFGSHAIVLAATDQLANDQAALKAVTRAAMTGGAPPDAPQPHVIHRVAAKLLTPASDGSSLSKGAPVIEVLAPFAWAELATPPATGWVDNRAYQSMNGISLELELVPIAPVDPSSRVRFPLPLAALAWERKPDPSDGGIEKTWFRYTAALPARLHTGMHELQVIATAGGAEARASRRVNLVA